MLVKESVEEGSWREGEHIRQRTGDGGRRAARAGVLRAVDPRESSFFTHIGPKSKAQPRARAC